MTVRAVCDQNDIVLDKALDVLRESGIEAGGDDLIRDLAADADTRPGRVTRTILTAKQ